MQTFLDVADNTGAKQVAVHQGPRRLRSRRYASLGDVIVATVKKAIPGSELKTGHRSSRASSSACARRRRAARTAPTSASTTTRWWSSTQDGNPKGTRIFGAVARELRDRNYMKIVSLAQEVV